MEAVLGHGLVEEHHMQPVAVVPDYEQEAAPRMQLVVVVLDPAEVDRRMHQAVVALYLLRVAEGHHSSVPALEAQGHPVLLEEHQADQLLADPLDHQDSAQIA